MNNICRKNIFYIENARGPMPVGSENWSNRFGVIVSNDALNHTSGAVEVVYLSVNPRNRSTPTHAPVMCQNRSAVTLCEQIHSVDKSRLKSCVGNVTDTEMARIEKAILFALQIQHEKHAAAK